VPIIRSWRLRDIIASCWYVPWVQKGCQVRLAGSASMDALPANRIRTRTYICLPLPQPVVTPPTPSGHSPSHWLRHFPTTTPSGINTPHVPYQSFFIHLPMKMEPIGCSETSAFRTQTPGNYPKENILHERICCHIACLWYTRVMRVKQMSTWNCAGSTGDERCKGLSNHTGVPTGRTAGTA